MPAVNDVGEPCAGEPHARFDGRGLETGAHVLPHRASPRPYSKDSAQPTFMIICGVDGWFPPWAR
jgi:hypothetical protein